jgi:uncharacterized membrane protein
MQWWQWALLGYVVAALITLFIFGYANEKQFRENNTPRDELGMIIFAGAIWPVISILIIPKLGLMFYNYRKAKEQHRIRVEAEAKVIREERHRSAALRPKRRILDLGDK